MSLLESRDLSKDMDTSTCTKYLHLHTLTPHILTNTDAFSSSCDIIIPAPTTPSHIDLHTHLVLPVRRNARGTLYYIKITHHYISLKSIENCLSWTRRKNSLDAELGTTVKNSLHIDLVWVGCVFVLSCLRALLCLLQLLDFVRFPFAPCGCCPRARANQTHLLDLKMCMLGSTTMLASEWCQRQVVSSLGWVLLHLNVEQVITGAMFMCVCSFKM